MLETAAVVATAIVLLSDPHDPCGPASTRTAITALDHVRAIGNHLRALSRHTISFGHGNPWDGGATSS